MPPVSSEQVFAKKVTKCSLGHPVDKPDKGVKAQCDVCGKEIMAIHPRWRCREDCDYDVCDDCHGKVPQAAPQNGSSPEAGEGSHKKSREKSRDRDRDRDRDREERKSRDHAQPHSSRPLPTPSTSRSGGATRRVRSGPLPGGSSRGPGVLEREHSTNTLDSRLTLGASGRDAKAGVAGRVDSRGNEGSKTDAGSGSSLAALDGEELVPVQARWLRLQLANDIHERVQQSMESHNRHVVEQVGALRERLEEFVSKQHEQTQARMEGLQKGLKLAEEIVSGLSQQHREQHRSVMQALDEILGGVGGDGMDGLDGVKRGTDCTDGVMATKEAPNNKRPPRPNSAETMEMAAASSAFHLVELIDGEDTATEKVWRTLSFKERGKRLLSHPAFDIVCGVVITLNAIHISVSSDIALSFALDNIGSGPDEARGFLRQSASFFFIFYLCELLLKLIILRVEYFVGEDKKWNLFDLLLVCSAIYSMVMESQASDSEQVDMTWMRLLRLLKMLKMLRMVRVMSFFKELRMILHAVEGSATTLLWAMVMLFMVIFIFAVCFMQGIIAFLNETLPESISSDEFEIILRDWSSLGQAMISLFSAVTGGTEWQRAMRPVKSAGIVYYMLFLLYIAFMILAVLNVLTGMFVDTALKVAQSDYNAVVDEVLANARHQKSGLVDLFTGMDSDGDGMIGPREFEERLKDERVQALFTMFEICANDAKKLYTMMRHDGEAVSAEELANGCMNIRGAAKSIDATCLLTDMKRLMRTVEELKESCSQQFEDLSSAMRLAHSSDRKSDRLRVAGAGNGSTSTDVSAVAGI